VNGDDGMVILKIIAINADIMAYSLDNDGRWSTASDSTMKVIENNNSIRSVIMKTFFFAAAWS